MERIGLHAHLEVSLAGAESNLRRGIAGNGGVLQNECTNEEGPNRDGVGQLRHKLQLLFHTVSNYKSGPLV